MTKTDIISLELYNLCNQKGLNVYKEFGTNFPSHALLQKWFRDEHNLHLCLQPLYGGNQIKGKQIRCLCYTPLQNEKFNNKPSISLSRNTYEEALEQGLIQAFNLI